MFALPAYLQRVLRDYSFISIFCGCSISIPHKVGHSQLSFSTLEWLLGHYTTHSKLFSNLRRERKRERKKKNNIKGKKKGNENCRLSTNKRKTGSISKIIFFPPSHASIKTE